MLEGATVEAASPNDSSADFVVRTRDGRTTLLEVKWAGEGWPQDVRRVAAATGKEWPENAVLLARHLSPGAIEWLREHGANWADDQDPRDRVLAAALEMLTEVGVNCVKFYPLNGRLDELTAVAGAAAERDMIVEPTGGITPDNLDETRR